MITIFLFKLVNGIPITLTIFGIIILTNDNYFSF